MATVSGIKAKINFEELWKLRRGKFSQGWAGERGDRRGLSMVLRVRGGASRD